VLYARPSRVAVCDGNASLAGVLAELLGDEPGFSFVGTATSGAQAVRLAQECEADVFLLDERLDDALQATFVETLREACPQAVLVLWSHNEVHTAAEGVDAVLTRGITFRELVRAIRATLRSHRPAEQPAR
jgi:DNA-binding NarL/FixJ family response regulator